MVAVALVVCACLSGLLVVPRRSLGLSVEAAAVVRGDGLSSWVDAGILLWLKSCVCIRDDGPLSPLGGVCLLSGGELG